VLQITCFALGTVQLHAVRKHHLTVQSDMDWCNSGCNGDTHAVQFHYRSLTSSRSPSFMTASCMSAGSATASRCTSSNGTDVGVTNSFRFILMLATIFDSRVGVFLLSISFTDGTRHGTPPGG
jgi:hypothetical protein